MIYKAGDKVILSWPEKSHWKDTATGVAQGYLRKGKAYIVVTGTHDEYGGPSITLLTRDRTGVYDEHWSLGQGAVEPYTSKRKLPDWW